MSPVVTYLAHEDCAVNGNIYSVAGGRVAQIFIAETNGVVLSELTAEAVRASLASIEDKADYLQPESLHEATVIIGKALS